MAEQKCKLFKKTKRREFLIYEYLHVLFKIKLYEMFKFSCVLTIDSPKISFFEVKLC